MLTNWTFKKFKRLSRHDPLFQLKTERKQFRSEGFHISVIYCFRNWKKNQAHYATSALYNFVRSFATIMKEEIWAFVSDIETEMYVNLLMKSSMSERGFTINYKPVTDV